MNTSLPYTFSKDDVELLSSERLWQHTSGFMCMRRICYQYPVFGSEKTYTVHRTLVEKQACAIVLPYDPCLDAVVLIEQVRPAQVLTGSDSPCSHELCAGIVDDGEQPLATALRELQEESGIDAKNGRIEEIASYWTSPGMSTEKLHLFCIEVDASQHSEFSGLDEEHESIKVSVVPSDQFIAILDAGGFDNGGLLVSALWFTRHRDRLRQQWV